MVRFFYLIQLLPHFGSKSPSKEVDPFLEPRGLTPEQLLEWTFLLDVLNFCFWAKKDSSLFTFDHRGQKWTGYRSMRAALAKAVEEDDIPIYSPLYYRDVSLSQLRAIFKSESSAELPLLERRRDNLHEAAAVLEKVGTDWK